MESAIMKNLKMERPETEMQGNASQNNNAVKKHYYVRIEGEDVEVDV